MNFYLGKKTVSWINLEKMSYWDDRDKNNMDVCIFG